MAVFVDMMRSSAEAVAPLTGWLDHLDSLDADFLCFYGIDLEEEDVSGPRFFSLAEKTFAYGGVMTRWAESQQEQAQPVPSRSPAVSGAQDAPASLPLAQFSTTFGLTRSSDANPRST